MKTLGHPVPPRNAREGASLVEVMLSITILGILAISATSYFEHAGSAVEQNRNRRVALEAAGGRMEALRQSLYEEITPSSTNGAPHYLQPGSNDAWTISGADPGETILVNGKEMPIQTIVQYIDADGDSPSYDYLRAEVRVGYRVGGDERVEIETRISP